MSLGLRFLRNLIHGAAFSSRYGAYQVIKRVSHMDDRKSRSERSHEIDDNLKRVFEQTLEEEIPQRFKDLLSQLRDSESAEKDGK